MKKGLALGALALACSPVLAACGDDEDEGKAGSETKSLTLTLKGKKLSGPPTAEAGLNTITFTNQGKEGASLQLVKVSGNHTPEELNKAGEAWGDKGKALPDWIRFAGGTGEVQPGASSSVTQVLEPGKYVVLDIDTETTTELEVTGEPSGELPSASATVEAVDYSFNSTGLKAGKNEIVFENTGKEPHFAVGLPMKAGKTIDDVKKFVQTEKGEEPFTEKRAFNTAILEGGGKQVVTANLKKGKYAVLCFIPDRAGGPPHVAKGMVAEATVE